MRLTDSRVRVLLVAGTRPEVIKLAPVARCLQEDSTHFAIDLVAIEQQRDLVRASLAEWKLEPTAVIALEDERRSLTGTLSAALRPLGELMKGIDPNWVIVQGDTTSALAGALAAYYEQRNIVHVEAGLRSGDPVNPFPEEMQRQLIDRISSVRYAPTETARGHLIREGIDPMTIHVIGNTVVDAMRLALRADPFTYPVGAPARHRVLVTLHRRESFAGEIEEICTAIARVARTRSDLEVLFVLHPNPSAAGPARRTLSGVERVTVLEPQPYSAFLRHVSQASVIVTDSGGIQEEAPYFGKPVIVARRSTERPEAIEAGSSELTGTRGDAVCTALCALLDDPTLYADRARRTRPFGDGHASERLREDLLRRQSGRKGPA